MRTALILAVAFVLSGCDSGTEERTEVASTRVVQRPSLPVPPGAIPRGTAALNAALSPPGPQVTPLLLDRGRERFAVFCSPCHGAGGRGDGAVVLGGFPPPPSFLENRLKALPPHEIVTVITHGKGRMFSFADAVPPEDRWAIAHYVKDLQAGRAMSAPVEKIAAP